MRAKYIAIVAAAVALMAAGCNQQSATDQTGNGQPAQVAPTTTPTDTMMHNDKMMMTPTPSGTMMHDDKMMGSPTPSGTMMHNDKMMMTPTPTGAMMHK